MGLIHFSLIGVGMIWLIPRDTALYINTAPLIYFLR